jgi:hypothetical protein
VQGSTLCGVNAINEYQLMMKEEIEEEETVKCEKERKRRLN